MTRTTHLLRSRWAAFGAVAAISLGAGGLGLASAAGPEAPSAYVPIAPCRLADTRPASNVGPIAIPLGADTAVTYDGWGDVPGDCDLPAGTTALQLNVTAVGASQLTNLRLYPSGTALPGTSSLNPAPGAAPTPNAVTVRLDAAGRFDVYNRFGQVDVLIDVAGYYRALDTAHDHDDRYYTEAETDAAIANAVGSVETGMPDGTAYTKAETDALLAERPTIDQVSGALGLVIDSVYSKAETDALVADAIAAAAPGEQTVNIPPQAFASSYADIELVTDSYGTYPTSGAAPYSISAPLVLPVGATITSITYYVYDAVVGQVDFSLAKSMLGAPSSSVEPATTIHTNIDGGIATVDNLAIVVPADAALNLSAWSSGWVNGSHDLAIMGATVSYTLP